MGIYLNSTMAYTLYEGESKNPYFVDKSQMLEELFPLIKMGNQHICITRPRRFGKSVMANMIAAFFSKGCNAKALFDQLTISDSPEYETFRNHFSVIHISLNDIAGTTTSYEQYIGRFQKRLIQDFNSEYPEMELAEESDVNDALVKIYTKDHSARFIFVLDEWDFIFHKNYVTEQDKEDYLQFLRSLLKDRPYVLLAYMTGILLIAKYSSGSELNMFVEFTMAKSPAFSDYFGFTQAEVQMLYGRYIKQCKNPKIRMEELQSWYNGYHTAAGERVFNPRSVVLALRYNHLESYWTSAGPYDEIYYYIMHNVDDVRADLALMVSGISVPAKIQEYAATSMHLQTRDEIFSAMVVYGFLSYENGKVSIPNQELMEKFSDMLQKETSLGYVDFIFYPERDKSADGIILELKVDHTPEEAISQIKKKKYELRFFGKVAEKRVYTGRVLVVGIGYDKKEKKHHCKVEVVTEKETRSGKTK